MPHKVDNKVTKSLYKMDCDDKGFIMLLSSEKEFNELCVNLVVFRMKKYNNRFTLNILKHIQIKYFLLFSLFWIYSYLVIVHGERVGTPQRKDAATQRRKA